jgi:hypothetical protein
MLALTQDSVLAQSGMALSLDGINSYMEVANHDELNIDAGENFSVTLWIKTSSTSDFYRILSKRAAGNGPGYEMITQAGAGAYGMNLRSIFNTNSGPPFGNTVIADGSWHHLAMIVDADNGNARIFVDGNQEQMSTVAAIGTESFANNVPLLFGTNITQANFMQTLLDDVRIWQVALSPTEIAADMVAVVDGTEPDLIAAWDFEDLQGNHVPDATDTHPGTLYGGATVVNPNAPMQYTGTELIQRRMPVGQGEVDQGILGINIQTIGNSAPLSINSIELSLNGTTDYADVDLVKLYYTGTSNRFEPSNLFGSASPQAGIISVNGMQTLAEGNNYFWISYDITPDADEGHLLDATCEAIWINGNQELLSATSVSGSSTILLEHKALFSGGDYGSGFFRIPAITTATDGSLVVLTDARYNNTGDLPNNIDVLSKRSTDRGESWSEAVVVADFGADGAGDASVVTDRNTGALVALFPSYNGFFQSTPNDKIRMHMSRSMDQGISWSTPVDISDMIYAPGWYANFVTSGAMHQMRNGRIIAASVVRPDAGNALSDLENYMIFSDDGGLSWGYMASPASGNANEAKLVELDNGNLMMNIRAFNNRKIVLSDDGGESWGTPYTQNDLIDPFVNGELIRYTSTLDGYDKSRLLFSIAASTSRENMSVFLSYDEGQSWGISKVIYPGPSAYSALTVLDDGTIGLFYENGEYETYQMYFARFSLDWLTDGNDTWLPALSTDELSSDFLAIQIRPNPSAGATTLELNLQKSADLMACLYTSSGERIRILFEENFEEGIHQKQLNLDHLPSGNYYLEIQSAGTKTIRKLIRL